MFAPLKINPDLNIKIKEVLNEFNYYSIKGYFKSTSKNFDGYIVTKLEKLPKDSIINEAQVFKFNISEDDIRKAIRLRDLTENDFVITEYAPLFL